MRVEAEFVLSYTAEVGLVQSGRLGDYGRTGGRVTTRVV